MAEAELFMTRVVLDTRKRSVRSAVADPRDLHRCLMKAFPDGLGISARATAKVLYRVERGGRVMLAQSTIRPELDRLPDGFAATTIETTPLLDRLEVGLAVRYECVATPVKREKQSKRELALKGADATQWWSTRAATAGLTLATDGVGDDVVTMEDRSVTVRRWRSIGYVSFAGIAQVADGDLLRAAVQSGIGRNKNWGAGLLTLAPVR